MEEMENGPNEFGITYHNSNKKSFFEYILKTAYLYNKIYRFRRFRATLQQTKE